MKVLSISLSLLFILLITISCEDQLEQDLKPKLLSGEAFYNQLLEAYNDSCNACLGELLDHWNKSIDAKNDIPDSITPVYEVYKEFYSPWDLARTSESEFGNDIYDGISYYLIQDSINYLSFA